MKTEKLNRKNKTETSKTPETPTAAAEPSAVPAAATATRSRNGKIARLPLLVRALLNQRLADNEPGPAILDWLNALPQTRSLVADSFQGVPISLQNLSQWRLGGFVRWQTERNMEACWENLSHFASYVEEGGPQFGNVADDLVTVLSAQYAQLVTAACGLDGGEVADWEKRLQALRPLLQDAIQLQRAMQRAVDHHRAVERAQKADEAEEAQQERRNAVALEAGKLLSEALQMHKNAQDLAKADQPTGQMESEAEEKGESKPIKANQSQSNPKTAAPASAPPSTPSTASTWPLPADGGSGEYERG